MTQANVKQSDILIVDDTPDNLTVLTRMLTHRGYTVRPAISGPVALKAVQNTLPALILLDVMMPGMDGYEVCRHLKANETTRDIPVLFISALDDTMDKIKAFDAGGVDYITKPFQAQEVLARVETHLKLRNMQKRLEEKNTELQQEIIERERAEKALRQHSWRIALLNQMNTSLQACPAEDATYNVLKDVCQQLFPSDSGSLYIMNEAQNALNVAACWGSPPSEARIVNDCWDMPGGSIYVIEHPKSKPLYLHLSSSQDNNGSPYALRDTSGKILGIFFLSFGQCQSDQTEEERMQAIESKQLLATRIAEQYALFLANLRLREALKREAIRDPLTGLFNRRYMEESLEREASRAVRNKSSVGIMMLDVDHFKVFNDTHGHEAGDVVLQHLGELLQDNIRGGDIACRYGGEEFLLILPDALIKTTEFRAKELLSQVRELNITYQNTSFHITISIGVATLPDHGTNLHDVVITADTALYQAKQKGRDQVVVASRLSSSPSTG